MKKKVKLLLIMLLLAVSSLLPVCAAGNTDSAPLVNYSEDGYYEVYNNMICFCYFNSDRSVIAGTSMNGQTVTIISKVYGANGNSIGSGGNVSVNSVSTTYSIAEDIYYIENTHSAAGITYTRRLYR